MAKRKNTNVDVNTDVDVKKEEELFAAPQVTEVVAPTSPQEDVPQTTEKSEPIEMELELNGEDVIDQMEEVVSEKVKKEEKENKENKSKRGPKAGSNKEKEEDDNKENETKKEKELDLKNLNIIQREIKKGRISAPQGRIEKADDGYLMKLAEGGIIFPKDANYKEFDKISKMNDGKFIVTNQAAKVLGVEKFKAIHENGQEVEHNYVRVELSKPGREKDVVMLFTVTEAKNFLRESDAKSKRKEEEDKKKAEKAAKEAENKVDVVPTSEDKKEEAIS